MRVQVGGEGRANVDTGLPVLDRLLGAARPVLGVRRRRRARARRLREGRAAGRVRALGEALAASCALPTARATGRLSSRSTRRLRKSSLEVSDRAVLASNVDLSEARVGGLGTDLVTGFLRRFAEGAGITLHVRLMAGDDAQHVLEAMFKALGVALARACRPRERSSMDKEVVRTEAAPAPFQGAPYSQAIKAGGLVFVSGQVALQPGSPDPVSDEIGPQTEQVFANLRAILEAAGTSLERVVKTTVYLRNLGDFQEMNEVYRRYVGDLPPARATIEVSALPAGSLVEIDAIALA